MEKLKLSIKMLWSNASLIEARKIPLWIIVIIFVINVSLVSVPNYFGLLQGIRTISDLEQIEETFELMYEMELPCVVNVESQMVCDSITDIQVGEYRIVVQNVINAQGTNESTIFFGRNQFAIVYVAKAQDETQQDVAYILSGDYRLLAGFDFSKAKTAEHSFEQRSQYYEYATDIFLTNIYYSGLGDQTFMIFASQFSQMIIYLIVISILFMLLNYRTKFRKVTYLAATKIIILSMVGPALLTAVLGVFITAWASMLFILLYGVRIMFVYYRINRTQESLM